MQAIGRQSQRVPDGAPLHFERHRPEQTKLYRLVQRHAASFIAHTEARTEAELPQFIKDEFDAFFECGILAHGFLRDNNLAFLGFVADPQVICAYRLHFPEDRAAVGLRQLQSYENDNPETFFGMYQFWIQKPAEPFKGPGHALKPF